MNKRMMIAMVSLCMSAASCTAGGASSAVSAVNTGSGVQHAPVTLNLWSFYTGREFDQYTSVLADFKAKYPWITIAHSPGKTDQDLLRSVNSGTAPDLAVSAGPDNVAKFCDSKAYQDLTPFLQQDGMDITKIIPEPALRYTSYKGNQCTLPVLSDAYGLYYNTAMFQKAQITTLPKTLDELTADAKALTQFNTDGSIKVAGFVPLSSFYEAGALYNGVYSGGQWYDANGKSAFGTDSSWASLLTWQKDFITKVYGAEGYSKLQNFVSALGGPNSEWSTSQGFETSQIAMSLDGEWRTAFITDDKSKVPYATVPFPVAAAHPELYGAGQIGGDVIGIPSNAPHPAEAWLLLRYLATDTGAQTKLAQVLGNVPTTFEALKDPTLNNDPHFKPFLDIFANPHSAFKPLTVIGQGDSDLWSAFVNDWEAGKVSDLQAGLVNVANQIDQQFQLG